MELRSFGPLDGGRIDAHGSSFTLVPLIGPRDVARTVLVRLGPGESIGEHPAEARQLVVLVEGTGWVSSGDGVRAELGANEGACFEPGERHAAGTDLGFTALVVEGSFDVQGTPLRSRPS